MALVWRKKTSTTLYEIRNAGKTLRLYTNGVFHTQYNPGHAVTGSVWDLLLLPALMLPRGSIKRVLVLGIGGGAVVHLLKRYVAPEQIVGVELDPVHVSIAKHFFQLNANAVELVTADAVEWLQGYQGPPFDLIIEDLFMEQQGEPVAVVAADHHWFAVLLKHLEPAGMLVRNFVSSAELMQCAAQTETCVRQRFVTILSLSGRDMNRVGVFSRQVIDTRGFRKSLQQMPGLGPALRQGKLYFRIQRLK